MTRMAHPPILACLFRHSVAQSFHQVSTTPYTVHPFTRSEIESLAPETEGCYALYSGDICVYVGTGPLRHRLLAHLEGDIYCITLHHPRRWFEYQCDDPAAEAVRLIRELRPRCNPRID